MVEHWLVLEVRILARRRRIVVHLLRRQAERRVERILLVGNSGHLASHHHLLRWWYYKVVRGRHEVSLRSVERMERGARVGMQVDLVVEFSERVVIDWRHCSSLVAFEHLSPCLCIGSALRVFLSSWLLGLRDLLSWSFVRQTWWKFSLFRVHDLHFWLGQ